MTRKRCPFCNKQTTTSAVRCRHCGAQLQEVLLATDPFIKPPSKPFLLTSAAKVFLFCLIVGCGAIAGVAARFPHPAPSYNHTIPSQNHDWVGYQTTASDLYQNYSAYEAAAKLTTGNSAIQISGTIKSVGQNLFDETEVNLDAGSDSESVTVTLDHLGGDLPFLVTGTKVSIRCEDMTRILGPPMGQGCQLVQ
jgi:hypothetical protein